jgi:DNA invertase Pin-like site-specific DNA recombinase
MKRIAIYARVSTSDRGQDPANQLMQLREWCDRAGHLIAGEYVEHESGRRDEASRRQFDLVLFWSLDRFSREGMAQTIHYLRRLEGHGVSFHSFTEEHLSTDNELVRNVLGELGRKVQESPLSRSVLVT